MVDVGAGELCCDVPDRTPEDRIHKVLLLEKGALVVGAFSVVIEGEDAGMFFANQVGSRVLPTGCIIRMGFVEWRFRACALTAALVIVSLVGKTVLFGNPGKETRELGVGRWIFAVLKKLES